MAKENIVIEKSYACALRIIKLYKYLADTHKEYVISKQVLRSGTAIGALLSELVYAQSKADFINKFHIALKECGETEYWIEMLVGSNAISEQIAKELLQECGVIHRMLVKSITTAKENS